MGMTELPAFREDLADFNDDAASRGGGGGDSLRIDWRLLPAHVSVTPAPNHVKRDVDIDMASMAERGGPGCPQS